MNKTQLDKTLGTIKNYVDDGLSKKSDSGHTHKYAGSSSAGGAANSVKTNLTIKLNGGAKEGTDLFTFNGSAAKTINITPSGIGAAASSHGNHVPTTETANARKFLRNDNTWQTLPSASTSATGIVQLSSSTSGTSESKAATEKAVKTAYDKANGKPSLGETSSDAYRGDRGKIAYDHSQSSHDYASNRLATKLVPSGTSIAANTDLNTTNLIKVGSYYCSSDSTVQTLKNCPTGSAFMMEVYSPLSPTIDNEATGQWVYRVRKLMTYTGIEYIQMVNSSSTAGTFTYGSWVKLTPSDATTSASGLMTAAMVTKLNGIASGANKYTHPSYTAKSSGFYKVTVDASGHVSGTAAVVKSDITALGIPAQDTTYSTGTASALGLTKLYTSTGTATDGTMTQAAIKSALAGKADSSHGTHVTWATNAPKDNGTAAVGTSGKVAREDHVHPLQTTISGNAGSATKLQTARKIGNASFNGTADITLAQMGVADIQVVTQAKYEALVSAGTVNANTYYLISDELK